MVFHHIKRNPKMSSLGLLLVAIPVSPALLILSFIMLTYKSSPSTVNLLLLYMTSWIPIFIGNFLKHLPSWSSLLTVPSFYNQDFSTLESNYSPIDRCAFLIPFPLHWTYLPCLLLSTFYLSWFYLYFYASTYL